MEGRLMAAEIIDGKLLAQNLRAEIASGVAAPVANAIPTAPAQTTTLIISLLILLSPLLTLNSSLFTLRS
jgi:hypothetical protein